MQPARRSDGRRTRVALLSAAIELFARRGFAGVSLSAIGDAAGARPSQVNYHFGTKEALFVAAACRAVLEVAQRVEEAGARADSPEAYAEAIVRAGADAPELLMFAEAILLARHSDDHATRIGATLTRLHEQGEAAVRATLERHGWRLAESPRVEAEAFWSLMLGLGLERVGLPEGQRGRLTGSAVRLIALVHRAQLADPLSG